MMPSIYTGFIFFYNTSSPSYVQLSKSELDNLIFKLKEIKNEIQQLKSDSNHLLRSLLYYVLICLNRSYEKSFALKDSLFENTLTLEFKKLLEKKIKTHQKVSDYADLLQVSKSHLNKNLQQYFGKSCSLLIKERLLMEIKRELLFGHKSIAEIGYELGFSEPANLNRFFKAATGQAPGTFRSQIQNDNS